MDKAECFLLGAVLGMIITVVVVISSATPTITREDAIKHKSAHYDAVTGSFRWNDEEAK